MIKLPYGWDSAVEAAKRVRQSGIGCNMQIAPDIILELDSQLRSPAQTKTVADAVEQEGEKWTHTIDGLKVRFLVDGPDEAGEVPVVADDGYYRIFDVDQLKPIKPRISEAEAWRKVQDGHPAGFIMEKYNVVERG